MESFWPVWQARQTMVIEKIMEHLHLSIISLLIAIAVAVPLGIILTRYRRIAEPIIAITAILQTIPSLAILAFLIPFLGIGTPPAIVALIIYALLPILRNTYTGIKEVDPALKEAAMGMGMNSYKRLMKVELPLAMPVIMAGIRTSMVLIVGTTTIAALIGAGGLGELILLGIDRGGDIYLIILGAVPAALMAITLDALLRWMEKLANKSAFTSIAVMLVLSLGLLLLPVMVNQEEEPDLVIGGKLNAEPTILINMYKLLIEDQTDLEVALEPGLGKTTFVFEALQNGSIDIYPEFTGTAIVTHLGEQAESNDPNAVYQQAKGGMAETFDMAYLEPMAFNNTYTLSTKASFAEANNLTSIADLKAIEDQVTAGFTLEFNDREDGYVGIQDVYDITFSDVRTMEAGIRQEAIESGEVDIIDAYSTDAYMVELDLVSLNDTENLFPPYQGAPLMRQETLETYPELEEILNQLSGMITDEQMRNMNYQVDFQDADPETVAKTFLTNHNLLE